MEFVDILVDYGVPHATEGERHCRAGWVQLDCPFCEPGSNKFHMGYKITGGYLNCYKCGGHSTVATLCELTREPSDKIKKLLGRVNNFHGGETRRPRGKLVLPRGLVPLMKAHRKYLAGRGFDPDEIVETWKVQAIGPIGYVDTPGGRRINLAWRVFIPIIHRGELVSWTTRAIGENVEKRYLSAPEDCEILPHKSLLYGGDFCTHAACAIEGPLDVWKFGRGGVGLCGTGYSRSQVNRLAAFFERGVCLDNEDEAQRRARELCAMLEPFEGHTYNFRLDSKDPGAATDEEIHTMRSTLQLP